ncbi:putative membrane protein [Paenibacillus larvae subsp. larvae]|uniref:Putative membrane protein n=1 Tax=Paenibacillus larvae subsp. larvae TaxID=147375 RepID=A0A6C0QZ32_9BACL|nr:putative membrane protein [Paenibacillus larvae subsp. larvae]
MHRTLLKETEVNCLAKRNWSYLAWALVYIIVLLSFVTPFMALTFSLVMIPVMILFVKLNTKTFVVTYVISLLIVNLLLGWQGMIVLAIALFFLPPVLVMGTLYKKQSSARTVLTAGTSMLLGEFLLTLVIGYAFGFNFINEFKELMHEYLKAVQPAMGGFLQPGQEDWYINYLIQMLPLDLILFSLYFVFLTHGISRFYLRRTGETIPGLKPVKDWRLPKSFVWLYFIAFLCNMFLTVKLGSMLSAILVNLMPLLMLAFAVQAISFFFYLADRNKWNKVIPVLSIVALVLFFPILLVVYSLIGVFDAAFPIRERMNKR